MFTQDSQRLCRAQTLHHSLLTSLLHTRWYQDETMHWFYVMPLSSKRLCPFSHGLNNREEAFVCLCYKQTVKRSTAQRCISGHLGNTIPHAIKRICKYCDVGTGEKSSCQTSFWAECNGDDSLWQLISCWLYIPTEIFSFPLTQTSKSGKLESSVNFFQYKMEYYCKINCQCPSLFILGWQ